MEETKNLWVQKIFSILAILVILGLFLSCTPGNPSEEDLSGGGSGGGIRVSGVLMAGSPISSSRNTEYSASDTRLTGYQLYCVTVQGSILEASGVADSFGKVSLILSTPAASFVCSVLDPSGANIATLIFSDASGTAHGGIVFADIDVDLGPILVNFETGIAQATVPSYVTIVASNPPDTTITSKPSNPSTSQTAEFQFDCDQPDCTYQCKLDSERWASCTSPKTYLNLSDGTHTFGVRAKNADGFVDPSPASYNWTNQEVVQRKWLQVSTAFYQSFAIADDHSLWSWGVAYWLDNGTTVITNIPTYINFKKDLEMVTSAGFHTCALQTDKTIWCWGLNMDGQLGNGNTVYLKNPVQVGSGTNWDMIAAGYRHTCAIKIDGSLWCWGNNGEGQLGDGTNSSKKIPVQVGTGLDWLMVSGGGSYLGSHTCAIKSNGSLWCWGTNGSGQLGDGTIISRNTSTQVGSGTDWKQVDTGGLHSCAVKIDGSLWCWGSNYHSQLGDGTDFNRRIPVRVGSDTDWEIVTGGYNHTCAIKADGSLWCWGSAEYGQIGDGTYVWKNIPTRISFGNNWGQVGAGGLHTCAVKTDNSLWCWGYNHYGQLGDGTNIDKNYPVEVQ
jgi:alpha-tubulin suppressor-like RCC1 family protein